MEKGANITEQPMADRIDAIMLLLRQILGHPDQVNRLSIGLKWAIWNRVSYFARRFRAIYTNPPKRVPNRSRKSKPKPKPIPPPAPPRPAATPAQPAELKERKGWLLNLLPSHYTRFARGQLLQLLTEPAMIPLLAENPSLGRILRPMCPMLAIPLPDYLKLPKKPRKPRPPRRKTAAQQKPKPAQTFYAYMLEKYPPPGPKLRPRLPGHLYADRPPFKNSA
jgi:hypothetical protein